MASVSSSQYSRYITSGVTCSRNSLGGHGSSVYNLHIGSDGRFYQKKVGFADNICVFSKLESLVLKRSKVFSQSRSPCPAALSIRGHATHGAESSFELASDQLEDLHTSSIKDSSDIDVNDNFPEQQFLTETTGGDDNGKGHDIGRGRGGDDDDGKGDDSAQVEEESGFLLKYEEVGKHVQARGVTLPSDMAEAARTVGIRSITLTKFMNLQGAKGPLGAAFRASPMLRNRMLADERFVFKLLTEIAIDSGCATFAEVQKRGDDFWNEFELYMADLIVGVVVGGALVGMLAPVVQFKATTTSTGFVSQFSQAIQSLPSSVFEAATPGRKFSVQQRIVSFFYKSVQYGAVGFICGIVGQGIANSIMLLKRKVKKSEDDVPVPPLVKSAALWGVFLAVSANTRYQVVNGLERVVEGSLIAKRVPLMAMAFTICIRFTNNIYGGMQFVDWARWSGVQ